MRLVPIHVNYCGCCGRECGSQDWCADCLPHIKPQHPVHLPPWERTKQDCEFRLPPPFDLGSPKQHVHAQECQCAGCTASKKKAAAK